MTIDEIGLFGDYSFHFSLSLSPHFDFGGIKPRIYTHIGIY